MIKAMSAGLSLWTAARSTNRSSARVANPKVTQEERKGERKESNSVFIVINRPKRATTFLHEKKESSRFETQKLPFPNPPGSRCSVQNEEVIFNLVPCRIRSLAKIRSAKTLGLMGVTNEFQGTLSISLTCA